MKPNRSFRKRLITGITVYAVLFLILLVIINQTKLGAWTDGVTKLFRPILIGLSLAGSPG